MDNRGRFQAQGDNVEKSESWAQMNIIDKTEAGTLLDSLRQQLTQREFDVRDEALARARSFVNSAPEGGYQAQIIKTYSNRGQRKSVRIDVEIRAGMAFKNVDQNGTA